MTFEQMINELRHYVHCDVEDMTVKQIIEACAELGII